MEKTKLDLYDLWNEITDTKMDVEKISFLIENVETSNVRNTVTFLDMIYDYTNKVIGSLENIESNLERSVKANG